MKKLLITSILMLGSLLTYAQSSVTISTLGYNIRMYEDGKPMTYDLTFHSYNEFGDWNSNSQKIECTYKKKLLI